MDADREALERFVRMRDAVTGEYDATVAQLKRMKAEGKVKTATYQHLFARKTMLASMVALYKEHGLL